MLSSSSIAISAEELELQPRIAVWTINRLRHAWVERDGGEFRTQITFRPGYLGQLEVVFTLHSKRGG